MDTIVYILASIFFILAITLAVCLVAVLRSRKRKTVSLAEAEMSLTELRRAEEENKQKIETFEKDIGELRKTNQKQQKQIEKLKEELNSDPFDGRFPICSHCKDIRDAKGFWHPIEEYIQNLSDADFSHSLCPKCAEKLYPDMYKNGSKPYTLTWK
jgi:hypothetical protein